MTVVSYPLQWPARFMAAPLWDIDVKTLITRLKNVKRVRLYGNKFLNAKNVEYKTMFAKLIGPVEKY